MRLRALHLDFFGHFTNKTFDFGELAEEQVDFHVVYGPNEAGKTTVMEAYLRLLYGFLPIEPYAFWHQRKNLRVSATLEADGQALEFTRLPKRTGSLLDGRESVTPESAIKMHLGGLSMDDYRNLLCIDDDTIEKGGEEIAKSKGDIGALLFSAAAGISNLTGVLQSVKEDSDQIFRPRASTTTLVALKNSRAALEKQIKTLDVPVSDYRKLKSAFEVAAQREAHIEKERSTLIAEQAQLEKLLEAIPMMAQVDELETEILPLEDFPSQVAVSDEELVTLLTEETSARRELQRLADHLEDLQGQLAQACLDPAHLALSEELEALDTLRGRYRTAELDIDTHKQSLADTLHDMQSLVSEIDGSEQSDPVAYLATPATLTTLQQLVESIRETESAINAEARELQTLEADRSSVEQDLEALAGDEPEGASLEDVLTRFNVDVLSSRYSAARQAIENAEAHYHKAMQEMLSLGQHFDTVPELPVGRGEIERTVSQWHEHAQDVTSLKQQCDQLCTEKAKYEARINLLKNRDDVIDDQQIQSQRAEREQLWAEHKSKLTVKTAEAFELVMNHLDRAMQLRFAQASDLGTLRELENKLAESQVHLDECLERLQCAEKQTADCEQTLQKQARQLGFPGYLPPDVLLDWLDKREKAADAKSVFQRVTEKHQQTLEQVDRLVAELSQSIPRDLPELDELIATARRINSDVQAHTEKVARRKVEEERLMTELQRRQASLDQLQASLSELQETWSTVVAENFPKTVSADKLKLSLQALRDLRELEMTRISAERSLSSMQSDQRLFAEKVNLLAASVDANLSDSPMQIFDFLQQLNQAAVQARDNTQKLQHDIAEVSRLHGETGKLLQDIDSQIKQHIKFFPSRIRIETLADLRDNVARANAVIKARADRSDLKKTLLATLDLASLEDARSLLADTKPAELELRLGEVKTLLETIDDQYKLAIKERMTRELEMQSITADAEVAQLVEHRTTTEIQMGDVALQYLKLRIGHSLAEEAIRRYRDNHRSGMIEATEQAFAKLTNDAYRKLATQVDGSSEYLMAVDSSGKAKHVRDMSKGTRFQLYLALRAAAYEQLNNLDIRLPFLCDDIFETFDEDRTRSACHLMSHIGKAGQAIYLTHHRHVVDIAQSICGHNVRVHQIQ